MRTLTLKNQDNEEQLNGVKTSKNAWIYYHRGNEDGDRWKVNSNEYINWTEVNVKELKEGKKTNSRWQGDKFFFKPGVGFVDYFDSKIKAFFVEPTVYSKNVVKFHSDRIDNLYILGLLNSSYISYFIKKYITNTRTLQMNDAKLIPIVVASKTETEYIVEKVLKIINLKLKLFDCKNQNEKERINEIVKELEMKIDNTVYKLYKFDLDNDRKVICEIEKTLL